MKPYKLLFFDLDGTLTDPGIGITNSVRYALEKFGIQVPDRRELYRFIGPPLSDSFPRYYGIPESEVPRAIDYFHEYFIHEEGMFQNEVYAGIPELLNELKQHGYATAIASSKPEIFVHRILKHFKLEPYFDYMGGADLEGEGNRFRKADVIRYVMDQFPEYGADDILMIGDRKHDVEGARTHGIDSLGVLYGYGSREEFAEAGATYVVESVKELSEFLLNGIRTF